MSIPLSHNTSSLYCTEESSLTISEISCVYEQYPLIPSNHDTPPTSTCDKPTIISDNVSDKIMIAIL